MLNTSSHSIVDWDKSLLRYQEVCVDWDKPFYGCCYAKCPTSTCFKILCNVHKDSVQPIQLRGIHTINYQLNSLDENKQIKVHILTTCALLFDSSYSTFFSPIPLSRYHGEVFVLEVTGLFGYIEFIFVNTSRIHLRENSLVVRSVNSFISILDVLPPSSLNDSMYLTFPVNICSRRNFSASSLWVRLNLIIHCLCISDIDWLWGEESAREGEGRRDWSAHQN